MMIEVHWTCATIDEAKKVARYAVENRLAACVQIIPQIESHYIWQANYEVSQEVKVIFKTFETHFEMLRKAILSLCSYEVPEVSAVALLHVHTPYLEWAKAQIFNNNTSKE